MKDIILPLYKTNRNAISPDKISNNTFKFYSNFDYEILPESSNIIKTGFYLKNINFCICPTNIFMNYKCIPIGFCSDNSSLDINSYCYSLKDKNNIHFAEIGKILPKMSCIFYLNIVSSSNEENYIFNIIN